MDSNHPTLRQRLQGQRYGLLLIPLGFLLIFFFYPLLNILSRSLLPESTLDLSGLRDLNSYWPTIRFTVLQALASTTLTIGLALPGAYIFTRYTFPLKSLLLSLATLPFVLPTVVVAAAFSALIGDNGLINDALAGIFTLDDQPIQLERTLAIILIVHVFYNYAIALRMITGFWANQSRRMEEAAQVLGCSGWRLWWEIRLPILRPVLLAASVLVFIFTFTSFGVILILGGPRFATIEVEIYRAVQRFNLPLAATLSLVQIGVMFALMILYTRLQRDNSADLEATQQITRPPKTYAEHAFVYGNLLVIAILLFAPLTALILRSFMGDSGAFTLQNYIALTENTRQSILFVPPYESIRNSLVFAVMTTAISVLLGTLTAYLLAKRDSWFNRLLDPIFMLPLATSAVTLGFGFIITLDEPPLNLRTSPYLIPLAHTLVAMPFVVRSVLPALNSIPDSTQEAASVLGAAPLQIWRLIDLPLISRGLIVGATFAFTISMGEFGASVFIARPDTPTMPIVIERFLGQPGTYGEAMAMSALLMLVCAVSFIVIERVRTAGIGEF